MKAVKYNGTKYFRPHKSRSLILLCCACAWCWFQIIYQEAIKMHGNLQKSFHWQLVAVTILLPGNRLSTVLILVAVCRTLDVSYAAISKKVVGKKCTRQFQKVRFSLRLKLYVEPTSVALFNTWKRTSINHLQPFSQISWYAEVKKPWKLPTIPFGIFLYTFYRQPFFE